MTGHHKGPDHKGPVQNNNPSNNTPGGRAATPSDRVQRFLARLDTQLPIIAGRPARRAFLDRQLAGWERRYARFIATEGASEPAADAADPPQAADFLLTITGLAARRSALEHDPEKACPGLDPGWMPVFGKRSCSTNKTDER
jgi:aminoglycoside phosphotransferase (APT) family kinase protein